MLSNEDLKYLNLIEYTIKDLGLDSNCIYMSENYYFKYGIDGMVNSINYIDYERAIILNLDNMIKSLNCNEYKQRIQFQTLSLENSFNTRNYEKWILDIPKAFRADIFVYKFDEIQEDNEKLNLFKIAYSTSEYEFNIFNPILSDIKTIYQNSNTDKISNDEFITIYRGECSNSSTIKEAISWTLDYNIAKFFALRFSDSGIVYGATCRTDDIIAYIDNEEKEVLCFYNNLKSIKKTYISKLQWRLSAPCL